MPGIARLLCLKRSIEQGNYESLPELDRTDITVSIDDGLSWIRCGLRMQADAVQKILGIEPAQTDF